MSFVGNLLGKVVGGITGASQAADAAKDASQTQAASAQAGIDQQKQMLEAFQKVLAPYVNAGTGALTGQQDLLGLNGPGAQSTAISGVQTSPQFQTLQKQGEDSILANASATGGLRGGNVQAALEQFSPQLLAQLIEQQYGRLGNLATTGENAAAGVGSAGLQTGSNVASLLQQQGAATAGGQIAAGNATANGFNSLLGIGGALYSSGALSGILGGSAPGLAATTGAAKSASGLISPTSLGTLTAPSLPMLTKF